MVPGSTLIYGSSFWMVTLMPRSLSSRPIAAAVTPLPTELTTPPVIKMNFVISSLLVQRRGVQLNAPTLPHTQPETALLLRGLVISQGNDHVVHVIAHPARIAAGRENRGADHIRVSAQLRVVPGQQVYPRLRAIGPNPVLHPKPREVLPAGAARAVAVLPRHDAAHCQLADHQRQITPAARLQKTFVPKAVAQH